MAEWKGMGRAFCLAAGIVAWPLAFVSNITIGAVLRVLRPGSFGLPDSAFWGFNLADIVDRPASRITARAFRDKYAWHEALGTPNRWRNLNESWLLHRLLDRTGDRALLFGGYVLLGIVVLTLAARAFGSWEGLMIACVVMGSPLVVLGFVQNSRLEVVSSAALLSSLALALGDAPAIGGLAWSATAIVATMPAALVVLVALPGMVTRNGGEALVFAITCAPGLITLIYRTVRAAPILRARRHGAPWRPRADDMFVGGLAGLGAYMSLPEAWGTALVIPLAYSLSWRLGFGPSPRTWDLVFLLVVLAHATAGSVTSPLETSLPHAGLLALMALAYRIRSTDPFAFPHAHPMDPDAGWRGSTRSLREQLIGFPAITVSRRPRSEALYRLLETVERPGRVILEDRCVTTGSGLPERASTTLAYWIGDELQARGSEALHPSLVNTVDPWLANEILARFNGMDRTGTDLRDTARALGARWVLAVTPETVTALVNVGFTVVFEAGPDAIDIADRRKLRLGDTPLILLRGPVEFAIVTPPCHWKIVGDQLRIEAMASTTYKVRYRHDAGFSAICAEQGTVVESYAPFGSGPLRFMQLRANASGPLTLTYGKAGGRDRRRSA